MSPIGDAGSAVRKLADDLLELVIEPALEPYNFKVVRADKIASSGTITAEIIELVQSADLCIIDLTGHNANVFYECGRRHENARPFIQLINKGDNLPFDVAGIRTIHYDLKDARAVHETVIEVRRYVEAVTESGATVSGVSVATLAEAVDRIERKVDKLTAARNTALETRGADAERLNPFANRSRNPNQAFLTAFAKGDLESAAVSVSQMRERSGLKPGVLVPASIVASEGQVVGATILFEFLDYLIEKGTDSVRDGDRSYSRADALVALTNYYVDCEEYREGLSRVRAPLEAEIDNTDLATEERAKVANSIQKLAYGDEDFELAQEWAHRAIQFDPNDAAYKYNLSLVYEQRKILDLAESAIIEAIGPEVELARAKYIEQAYDIYVKREKHDDAERMLSLLMEKDPDRAAVIVMMRNIGSD